MPTVDALMSKNISNAIRNYETWGGIVINAKDYGAKGDGITDDSNAIQNAIQDAITKGIKRVIGAGLSFRVTKTINITSSIVLDGFTFLGDYTPTTAGDPIINITGDDITLTKVNIDGLGNDHTGINLDGCNNVVIKDGYINNCKWSGIMTFNSPKNFIISNYTFDSCTGTFLGGVVQIQEYASYGLIELCEITNTAGKGFVAIDCNDIKFLQCKATDSEYENFSPRRDAIRIKFEKCVSIKNNVGILNSGVKCSRGAIGVVFEQCLFEQRGGTGVVSGFHNQGCSDVTVKDSTIISDTDQCVLISWHPEDGPEYPATPANNIKFENCKIDGVDGANGIRLDPSFGFTHLEDISIVGCTFENYTTAIRAIHVKNLRVLNNVFKSSAYQTLDTQPTILIDGTSTTVEYSANSIVSGNTFEGTAGWAVRTFYSQDIQIINNLMIGKLSTTTLVLLDYSSNGSVSGNTFKAAFNTGINIQANTTGINISNNNFLGGGSGTAIRQNGIKQTIIGNYFDVAAPLNPVTGGDETNVHLNSNYKVSYGTAAPTTGTWNRGDIIYNTTPSASGYVGWVCVASGTPGTWKGFGVIEA